MKQLSFSTIKLKQIAELVNIEPKWDDSAFDKWFNYPYEISTSEEVFLKQLLSDRRLIIGGFSEEELKAKFIIPLLNKIDFQVNHLSDWYERPLKAVINGTELGGKTDFLVASGLKEPEQPYFFIQEFKPSETRNSPQDQLLAELLVAMQLNQDQEAIGAYVMGEHWRFILLQKIGENNYRYTLSSGFNCLINANLKQLYIALQGVKADIVKKIKLDCN